MGSKTIVISPSGGWYGSEQVLFGHMSNTDKSFKIYVLKSGVFVEKLRSLHHKVSVFNGIVALYLNVFILLLTNYDSVYVNEGGHIRYIKLLAKVFSKKKFVIHVRLVEDTSTIRLQNLPTNVTLVCVSDFIRNLIIVNGINHKQVVTIHDYVIRPASHSFQNKKANSNVVSIGIVGRVSSKKGILRVLSLCESWEESQNLQFEVNFFGGVVEDEDVEEFRKKSILLKKVKCIYHGFVDNQRDIYASVDTIIHFNAFEPFPRIYFESICNLVPIVGFNSGGVGEQARIMGFEDLLVADTKGWENTMMNVLLYIRDHNQELKERMLSSWDVFDNRLNIKKYIDSIEQKF